ncbi:MAG: hypothetical protein IH618_14335 [Ignavibacteriaceae bacterium]|nr:hypothetical protein [Ignavibacteriaceae bacterium]
MVYDILDNEVSTLVNEDREAGNYEVEFSADSYSGLLVPSKRSVDGTGIYADSLFASLKGMTTI